MRAPLSWLREYVDCDASPEEIAEKLTSSGTEVEAIEQVGVGYDDIVVGEVLAIEPHPAADRLRLCKVDSGQDTLRVVCGADNFEVGDKAPFAGVGAVLPDGTRIKKAKIRGEESLGMLCAEDELGLSDGHAGIMLLSRDLAAGTPFGDVMGPPDALLHMEVTWNRSDCLSIIGIAREVAALFGLSLQIPAVDFDESDDPGASRAQVVIEDTEGCPRYTARMLSGLTQGPSPMWMQRRLSLCGVRPLTTIVDITNYVMLECGHPLHAFDHELLSGGKIVVRRARPGEGMATLDGVKRDLSPEMLVIADAERPVALAGIMGGAGSEIRSETQTVLLESACFDPADIHRTSQKLVLSTESSHRFERGVNVFSVDWASRRASALMVEHAGARVARGVIDEFPRPPEPRAVSCRFSRVRGLLGIDISGDEVVAILKSLEIPVVEQDAEGCVAEAPGFRPDLVIEADLIEEVARLHGLDAVKASTPRSEIVPGDRDDRARAVTACRHSLLALGLTEIVNYTFLSPNLLDLFGCDKPDRVVLPNPVSEEHSVLRPTLIPQMVETLGRNLAHQVSDAALFEMGRVFTTDESGALSEGERLCIGLMGQVGRSGMDSQRALDAEEMFFWLKGIVESFCETRDIGAGRGSSLSFEPLTHVFFSGHTAMQIKMDGKPLGMLGLLEKGISGQWRMTGPVGLVELCMEPLTQTAANPVSLVPIPLYPAVTRDLAMIVSQSVTHEEIIQIISKTGIEELTDVKLFDIFTGEGIGAGKKSLAYSLVYRSLERTLTDEEANGYHDAVKASLRKALELEIREG